MRRVVLGLLAAIVVLGVILSVNVQPTQALQAHIYKIKSDCNSVELGITLVWRKADNDQGQDRFRLMVFQREVWAPIQPLYQIDEGITENQSPFSWVTHRIPAPTHRGRYTIEVWDLDWAGNPFQLIDQVHYECSNNVSWRGGTIDGGPGRYRTPDPTQAALNAPPFGTCEAWMPLYTTNRAPESGAIILVWSGLPRRDAPEFHWRTIPVAQGDYFTGEWVKGHMFKVPCGVYIRAYFQPDSTKLLYQMPSQYWPDRSYGVPMQADSTGPSYHTVFPLNGPPRTDEGAPPTATPRPVTPTPVPTITPTPTTGGG